MKRVPRAGKKPHALPRLVNAQPTNACKETVFASDWLTSRKRNADWTKTFAPDFSSLQEENRKSLTKVPNNSISEL